MGVKVYHIIQLLKNALIQNDAVYAIVSDRIYPGELASIENVTYPCITLFHESGTSPGRISVHKVSIVKLSCHAIASQKAADNLFDACDEAIFRKMFSDSNLYQQCEPKGNQIKYNFKIEDIVVYSVVQDMKVYSQGR